MSQAFHSKHPDRTPAVERQLEAYLEHVASGESPDLEAFACELSDDTQRSNFRVEALAGEILWHQDAGETVDLEAQLERLTTDAERDRLREEMEWAREATARLPWHLEPGSRVAGRYEIIEQIGSGGIGIVYEATDLELGRRVALKAVRVDPARDATELAKNLIEESRTLAGLESPNIVTIHDVLREGDRVCVVLALIRGVGLDEVITEMAAANEQHGGDHGGMSPSRKLEVLRQAVGVGPDGGEGALATGSWYKAVAGLVARLAHCMERAHAAGVLHRDLKPQNVMIDRDGEPMLLDFGLAFRVGAQGDGRKRFQGTPEYLAPEQIKSMETGEDPRTDIYAMGLLIYELLGLERAFPRRENEAITALLHRIQARRFKPLERLDNHAPVALRRICEHAMKADPDQRYTTMQELREDLERFVEGSPPRYAPLEWWPVVRMTARGWLRKPLPAAILAASLLVAWGGYEIVRPAHLGQRFHADLVGTWGNIRVLRANESLEVDEELMLGVGLEGTSSSVIYTLAVSSAAGIQTDWRVVPTHPTTMRNGKHTRPTEGGWGLVIPAGEHEVAASLLLPGGDSKQEGFWALLPKTEEPALEKWMTRLAALNEEKYDGQGIPYERAFSELEALGFGTRGGDPADARAEALFDSWKDGTLESLGIPMIERMFQMKR